VRQRVAELERRRDLVVPRLGRIAGVRCVSPSGAFYVFPHVAACYCEGRRGSIELAELLLERAGVALVPGLAFGADDHLRVSFGGSREELKRGMDRIEEVLVG